MIDGLIDYVCVFVLLASVELCSTKNVAHFACVTLELITDIQKNYCKKLPLFY